MAKNKTKTEKSQISDFDFLAVPVYQLKEEYAGIILKSPNLMGAIASNLGYTSLRTLENHIRDNSPVLSRIDILEMIWYYIIARDNEFSGTIKDLIEPKPKN